jgi:Holliday junction resolvase RusA-like endonuclease
MYTLAIPNQIPLSQNRRHYPTNIPGVTRMDNYRTILSTAFNARYPAHVPLTNLLYGKVFWIHRVGDGSFERRDADNFSKPLWDALNALVYNDDRQIRLRQTAKLQHGENNSLTVNVDDMEDVIYEDFLNFHLDAANTDNNWLYIELGEFNYSHVKFGER